MKFAKFLGRFGVISSVGCTIHCFFEYICDFVVCSGKFSVKISNKTDILIIFFLHFRLGESMQPTLFSNNILICNKIAHRTNKFQRNDIVIAIHPKNPHNLICKRVIG